MKVMNDISIFISKITGFNNDYIYLGLLTVLAFFIMRLIKVINCRLYKKFNENSKDLYVYNQKAKIITSLIFYLLVLIIWSDYFQKFITLISFVSASLTLALRDLVVNFFCGLYIKIKKPFEIEDRIEINDVKGDVINLNSFSFELLEIGENMYGEQSTGRIVHIPNSVIFSSNLKNYVKAFKYVWNEVLVRIPLDSDVRKTKGVLYRIVNKNDVVRNIPSKMANQINDASMDYRIYYNKLKPIIYVKVVGDHIELYIRYLVHPKKARNVEDELWNEILKAYREGEIELFKTA